MTPISRSIPVDSTTPSNVNLPAQVAIYLLWTPDLTSVGGDHGKRLGIGATAGPQKMHDRACSSGVRCRSGPRLVGVLGEDVTSRHEDDWRRRPGGSCYSDLPEPGQFTGSAVTPKYSRYGFDRSRRAMLSSAVSAKQYRSLPSLPG